VGGRGGGEIRWTKEKEGRRRKEARRQSEGEKGTQEREEIGREIHILVAEEREEGELHQSRLHFLIQFGEFFRLHRFHT